MARRVDVKVRLDSNVDKELKKDSNSVRKLSSDLQELGTTGNRSLKLLSTVGVAGLVAGFVKLGSEAVQLADKYSLLRSQLKLVVDDVESLDSVQEQLLVTSNKTRQSLDQTIKLYTKLDRATKELSLSDSEVIELTETLNKAFIISGSSSDEAANGVRQLTQAIQGGILRAEEYNSIIEQTPRIAELFADSLKVTQGEFRKLVIEGKVTTKQLIDAIREQTGAINEEFGKIEATSGQTWTVLTNNAESYIVKLQQVNSLQGAVNSLLGFASGIFENLDKAKTLEIAKKTEIENRTLAQQAIILKDLNEQLNGRDATYKNVADRIRSQIQEETKNLELIQKRTEAENKQLQIDKERKKNEKERAEASKIRIENEKIESDRAIEAQLKLINIEKENEELRKQRARERVEQRKNEISALNEFREQEQLVGLEGYELSKELLNQRREDQIEYAESVFNNEKELKEALAIIDKQYYDKVNKLDKQSTDAKIKNTLLVSSTILGAFKDIFGENKAFAVADIIINTARGIQRSFADLPPPFNAIQAGAIGATGVAQLAKVNSAKYADGTEFVSGSGGSRDDKVSAFLSRGERVIDSNNNARLNGVSNEDLVNGNRDNFSILGLINVLFSPEEIAQKLTDYSELASVRGLTPQL